MEQAAQVSAIRYALNKLAQSSQMSHLQRIESLPNLDDLERIAKEQVHTLMMELDRREPLETNHLARVQQLNRHREIATEIVMDGLPAMFNLMNRKT